jgi:hypothetical protein
MKKPEWPKIVEYYESDVRPDTKIPKKPKMQVRYVLIPPSPPLLKPYEPMYTKRQWTSSLLKIFAPLYILILLSGILISWSVAMIVFIFVGLLYLVVFLTLNV